MKLEGIHHVTGFTADAQRNLDFYAGVLGLRFVKKSVNQDDTSVYHSRSMNRSSTSARSCP
jgi:glyoxalase family protein